MTVINGPNLWDYIKEDKDKLSILLSTVELDVQYYAPYNSYWETIKMKGHNIINWLLYGYKRLLYSHVKLNKRVDCVY